MPNSTYVPRGVGGVATGLTADSGSVQAGATLCSEGVNLFDTVATIGDSAVLPAGAALYDRVLVVNNAANSMDVFPNVGATINGGAADAALAVAGTTAIEFIQVGTDGLTWAAT